MRDNGCDKMGLYMTRYGNIITENSGVPSLNDIIYGLSATFRYNGCSNEAWMTVATHSMLCYKLLKKDIKQLRVMQQGKDNIARHVSSTLYENCNSVKDDMLLAILLHDAAECIIGDIPSPFKTDEINRIEKTFLHEIYRSLNVEHLKNTFFDEIVKYYDRIAFMVETTLLGLGGDDHGILTELIIENSNYNDVGFSDLTNFEYTMLFLYEDIINEYRELVKYIASEWSIKDTVKTEAEEYGYELRKLVAKITLRQEDDDE